MGEEVRFRSLWGEERIKHILILFRQCGAQWHSDARRVQWCLFCFLYLLISHHL